MSAEDWRPVAKAMLGTWPEKVAAWGREGLAAYTAELAARGVTPDMALQGIRTYDPAADFPPSAAKLAQAARRDPSRPTFDEALVLLQTALKARPPRSGPVARYDSLGARWAAEHQAVMNRAQELHPFVAAFIARQGVDLLRRLELDDPEYGPVRRRDLAEAWDRHVEAFDGRDTAALASGDRRRALTRLDPLAALTGPERPQIQATHGGTT